MNKELVFSHVHDYLHREKTSYPYMIGFDSAEDLHSLRQEFSSICSTLRISDFCQSEDAFPDTDRVFTQLENKQAGNIILLGVGEYASISSHYHFLERLSGLQLPQLCKLVVPLWNGYEFLEQKRKQDIRIDEYCMAGFCPKREYWSIQIIPAINGVNVDVKGFKAMLAKLENGCNKEVTVQTNVPLSPIWSRTLTSAYAFYMRKHPACTILQQMFSEEQWKLFLDDSRAVDKSLLSADKLLELKNTPPEDGYLAYVVEQTDSFEEYQNNLVKNILNIKPTDKRFFRFYSEWKEIMKKLPLDAVRQYIAETHRFDGIEQLAYLSDNTTVEKIEILAILCQTKELPKTITTVWPQLAAYNHDFIITIQGNQSLANELTDYFSTYKRQKLLNTLSPDFRMCVEDIARNRPYCVLPTRGSLVEKQAGGDVHLYWIDALGCEYLGFIQQKAEELGLKLRVQVARSCLPSLTSLNRDFYDEWKGGSKEMCSKLDDTKHGNFDDYGYNRKAIPVELAYELDILEEVMESIASRLKNGLSKKVVLTSDHGATRLAVISEEEITWEMPEKGKHSGRCCKANEFDGQLPSVATHDDNGEWNVLANYNRFRGGRMADVEVHGGATFEELVVPVIEFELADVHVTVELLTKEFGVTYKDKTITLVLFSPNQISNMSLECLGERFMATRSENNVQKFEVTMPTPKTGDYTAKVYDGDTCIGSVSFIIKSSGVGVKKDDFFDL